VPIQTFFACLLLCCCLIIWWLNCPLDSTPFPQKCDFSSWGAPTTPGASYTFGCQWYCIMFAVGAALTEPRNADIVSILFVYLLNSAVLYYLLYDNPISSWGYIEFLVDLYGCQHITPWPRKSFSSAHLGDEYLCQVSLNSLQHMRGFAFMRYINPRLTERLIDWLSKEMMHLHRRKQTSRRLAVRPENIMPCSGPALGMFEVRGPPILGGFQFWHPVPSGVQPNAQVYATGLAC